MINAEELDVYKDGKARKITVASIHAYVERRLVATKEGRANPRMRERRGQRGR